MSARTGDSREFEPMTSWQAYCKGIALGQSFAASAAKLIVLLGAPTPSQALRACEAKVAAGELDGDAYRTYVQAIELLEDMHRRGVQTHAIVCRCDDWDTLPSGGHVRKVHRS